MKRVPAWFVPIVVVAWLVVSSAASAALTLPPRVTQVNAQASALARAGYLDATLYDGLNGMRVDPKGVVDSTAGIQQAINDALQYAMVAYLPSGTYLVSDTLLGQALDGSGKNISCLNHTGYGTPFSAPQSPSLVGPGSGARPVLKLKPGAVGFGDASNPKPVVHFLLTDKYSIGWQGDAACLMWAVLRDVDLDLGANPGAVGVQFAAAQYSYIENVSVTATGAYAGFQGVPTTNVVVNVAVDGGQYGIIPTTCCGVSLVGVTLKNQTVAALSLTNFASTMITGFDIRQSTGAAIINTQFASQTSEVALLDGQIVATGGSGPVVDNTYGHDLYASNVYVHAGARAIVASAKQLPVPGSGSDAISLYSFTNATPYTQGPETQSSYNVIDGVVGQKEIVNLTSNASVPSDLVSRHLPGKLPWFEDSGVLDVTTLGADPTAATDSTAAIQKAIDTSDAVFLPRGDYIISSTLSLRPNTHLFGVPGMRSRLHGASTWNPNGKYMPLVQSADTVDGATEIGDIQLTLPDTSDAQTYLGGLVWMAGRNALTRQLAVVLPWQNNIWTSYDRKLIAVQGHGGGRFYGLQLALEVPARTISATRGYRNVLVSGTTAPLTFYGPNTEHARNEPEMELDGVSNVRVLGIKTEATFVVSINHSNNVMFAAHSGHDGVASGDTNLAVIDSQNVLLAANQIYSGGGSSPSGYIVRESAADGGTLSTVAANDQCSLFERGKFDATAFPHCGDAWCDVATEDATSCPSDCAGGNVDAGPPGDGGVQTGDAEAGANGEAPGANGSCACTTAPRATPSGAAYLVVGLALLGCTRRRRRV